MTTVATNLIQGAGKFEIAAISVDGVAGSVFAKQSLGECRTGKVSIYIKVGAEKATRIGFFTDNREVSDLTEYVTEELIDASFLA